MDNQQRFAILVTASAGAIAVVVASGSFDSWDTIAGLTLVLILGAYGKELDATGRMRIAYGTVWALCVILVVGVGIEPLVRIPSVNSLLTDLVRRLPQVLKPTVIGLNLRNLVGFILWVILAVLRTAAYQGGRWTWHTDDNLGHIEKLGLDLQHAMFSSQTKKGLQSHCSGNPNTYS